SAWEQAPDVVGTPSVGLPDLADGGVGLICATIFCEPGQSPALTGAAGWAQLRWYEQLFDAGHLKPVIRAADLPESGTDGVHALVLMEGADPIQGPEELPAWFEAGVRMLGLAWRQTRYAGGTGAPGPLTADGVRLV